jgi:hypothetical protein
MEPVRKIARSHRSLRAFHPSAKTGKLIQLESALERDFCCLLEFGLEITSYVEQPVTIEYLLAERRHKYTPDFLVRYLDERPAVLVEVKYRADLRANWAEYKPKFRAAKQYAATKGWVFKLYTDEEIKTPYLRNVKFLLRFRSFHQPPRPESTQLLLNLLAQQDESTPEMLLRTAFPDAARQAELLPILWQLVSNGLVGCNLFQPLTMNSPLWHLDEFGHE